MSDHSRTVEPVLKMLQVYLREFVLPVRIGVFAHEKEAPQKVRFDVRVEVESPPGGVATLADILSYDLIREIVVTIAAERHIEFAETFAEDIARRVLREPRARRVSVQLEKLEMGPGRVGVEIVMERPD